MPVSGLGAFGAEGDSAGPTLLIHPLPIQVLPSLPKLASSPKIHGKSVYDFRALRIEEEKGHDRDEVNAFGTKS